jgi:multidrug efflux system outer membrane protein
MLRGMENDIYFQIGLVVLIGLAAKNAILIAEFAMQGMEAGLSAMEAAAEAARLRFRPIVMTSLAFVLGVVPLVLATGAGAAARRSMGSGVFGGMLVATFVAPLFIPLFFALLARKPRLRNATQAAQEQLLAAQHARDTVRLALVGTVAQAWLGVRALDVQRAAVDTQLRLRRDSLALVQRRVAGGLASALDQAQAEAALAALSAQQLELGRQRALLVHQLGQLSAQPGLQLPVDGRALPAAISVPAGLPSDLLLRRPDLQQAEATLRASFASFDVTRKSAWPTLALTGSLGGQSADLVDLLKAGARIWSIGPQLLVSVFDAGRNQARTDEARARAQQAAIGWQQATQLAFREVADALVNAEQAAASEAEVERQHRAALEAQRIATRRYEAGYSGYLEVLDAQRGAQDAELARVRVRQARLDASVALMKALGGGWQAGG